ILRTRAGPNHAGAMESLRSSRWGRFRARPGRDHRAWLALAIIHGFERSSSIAPPRERNASSTPSRFTLPACIDSSEGYDWNHSRRICRRRAIGEWSTRGQGGVGHSRDGSRVLRPLLLPRAPSQVLSTFDLIAMSPRRGRSRDRKAGCRSGCRVKRTMGLSMKFRTIDWLALFLAGVLLGGCDTGPTRDPDDATGPINQPGPGTSAPPVLLRVEGADRGPVCAGDVITLIGLNFSPTLGENEVVFTAGTQRVRGLPLSVRLDPTSCTFNVDSRLDVVVPGGVSRGNVELMVRGQSAGAAGLDVCPLITGFTLGLAAQDPLLLYQPVLGFIDGASRVTVYGLTLSDVQEIVVTDDSGNERRVPSNSFIRNPGGLQPGVVPTGYDAIGFNLRDDLNDVRLPFNGPRGNLTLKLGSGASGSRLPPPLNHLQAPVTTDAAAERIGIVVSGIKVPAGVVTGPVRFEYTIYEMQVDAEWRINFEFRAVNDQNRAGNWMPAKPLPTNILHHDGVVGITAGSSA